MLFTDYKKCKWIQNNTIYKYFTLLKIILHYSIFFSCVPLMEAIPPLLFGTLVYPTKSRHQLFLEFPLGHGLHLVRLAYLLMEAVSIFGGYNRYRIRVPAGCFVADRVALQQLVRKSNSTHVQIVVQDWSITLHHPFDHLPREARMDVGVNRCPHVHPFHKDLGALPNPSYWPLLKFWIFSEGIVSSIWTDISVVLVHTTGPKLYFWQNKEHSWAGIKTTQK